MDGILGFFCVTLMLVGYWASRVLHGFHLATVPDATARAAGGGSDMGHVELEDIVGGDDNLLRAGSGGAPGDDGDARP